MPTFTFLGNNASGFVRYGGYTFEPGKGVVVEGDDDLIRRLTKNPEFSGGDPLDHDGDGKAGGSLKGAQSTRRRRKSRKE